MSFRKALPRGLSQAGLAALTFLSLISLGAAGLSALIWLADAKSVPGYALAWITAWAVLGVACITPVVLLRRAIGRIPLVLAAGAAGGCLLGWSSLMGLTYRNSCSALGWSYDERADLLFPTIIWNGGWGCNRIGRYQQFAGVWTYGEWGYRFSPVGNRSLPIGELRLDDAGVNLMFDTMLHQRLSRYTGSKVYLVFRGNLLKQGRSTSGSPLPVYEVRDILAANLLSSGGTSPLIGPEQ